MRWWKAGTSIALAALTAGALMAWSDYPREAISMAAIFVLAACLWITEALPLFVTALIVIGAQIVALANPGGWPFLGFAGGTSPSVQAIVNGAADPVLLLFLGGLLLARAAERTDVGHVVSMRLLGPFGDRPAAVLLGVMIVTATFSMWMSNTAAAAMMLAIIAPVLSGVAPDDPFRKGLTLAVPFAANIGGLGTPIASPPNAVALGYLQRAGFAVAFLDWMLVAIPLMGGLLLIAWLLLWRAFPPRAPLRPVEAARTARLSRRGGFVVVTFAVTVLLWMTGDLHGIPAPVVALVPAVALTAAGIVREHDVNGLDWTILILIAGGISLGSGMQLSGLDAIVVGWLPLRSRRQSPRSDRRDGGRGPRVRTFMSNTAVANLLLPVGISAGLMSGSGSFVVELTMSIALGASLAMALPISTPPNAIAYGRGVISTRDMARIGAVVGVVAGALIVSFGGMVMRFWGVGGR